jgi:serine/threonine-protein kinase
LASDGPLEIDDLLSVITQLAQALDYAHGRDVYHHDIRPSNIYLKGDHAWLDNFCLLEAVCASATYVAPEQMDPRNFGAADHRSDTYALAVVLYEMLTGKPPFEGSETEVMQAHLTQRPKVPRAHRPDLLPALDAILLKALAKRPESRYQSASALADALHEAVQAAQTRLMTDSGVFSKKATAMQENAHKKNSGSVARIPTWVWVGAGVLLAVVVSVIILLATS